MFEDFENRMGFWKNLGSNFTIQYSGDAPSFMTDSEMWQSMDSGTTQTLAAWENGWVLTNNPDGTITANPKYTSGLPSETLTKVPVGFSPPTNTAPTDAGGGVVVAFNNEENNSTEGELGPGGEQQPVETNLEEEANCDNHQCPEGQNVMTSTSADGTVECSCFDGGKALRTVGYGLGALAIAGVATTGLVIYGIYRIVRG